MEFITQNWFWVFLAVVIVVGASLYFWANAETPSTTEDQEGSKGINLNIDLAPLLEALRAQDARIDRLEQEIRGVIERAAHGFGTLSKRVEESSTAHGIELILLQKSLGTLHTQVTNLFRYRFDGQIDINMALKTMIADLEDRLSRLGCLVEDLWTVLKSDAEPAEEEIPIAVEEAEEVDNNYFSAEKGEKGSLNPQDVEQIGAGVFRTSEEELEVLFAAKDAGTEGSGIEEDESSDDSNKE
jgi:hypothetical protein